VKLKAELWVHMTHLQLRLELDHGGGVETHLQLG